METTNTKVSYLYRDACNYKTWNEIIVPGLFTEEQINEIISCCEGGESFIPEQIGWDLVRGWDLSEDDHCYAEINSDSFVPTSMSPTTDMTVGMVVDAFKQCKNKWDADKYSPFCFAEQERELTYD